VKAFLLAAGLGTRMRPLTDDVPKCMLTVHGQPLLDIWLDSFRRSGVDEILVNVHHLPDVVRDHVDTRSSPPVIHTFYEPELLGSAGTLVANRGWVKGEELFLACNADNLTDFDLRKLIEFHRNGNAVATVTVFRAEDPSACGIVEVDGEGGIVGFVEKPRQPVGNLANAGMYAFHPNVLEELGGAPPMDISYDLLPRLIGRARTMPVEGYFCDIGTPDSYLKAQMEWVPSAV
jgi:mannose-1-phosphate guanylyltransferase